MIYRLAEGFTLNFYTSSSLSYLTLETPFIRNYGSIDNQSLSFDFRFTLIVTLTLLRNIFIIAVVRSYKLLTGIIVLCVNWGSSLVTVFWIYSCLVGHLNECSQNFNLHICFVLWSLVNIHSQQVALTFLFLCSLLFNILVVLPSVWISTHARLLAKFDRHEGE